MTEASTFPRTADECLHTTIVDCLKGNYVETPKDTSYELLSYSTGMSNPRARIVTNPLRPLNIVVAVARFTWMAAGNNRLQDIAFYEPKVGGFTDNGLTVPGSCYGNRLFEPRPGLNQIQGVVDRLRENPGTRRAAAVVWAPEDAVRVSQDIPCTFGVFFHVRGGKLNMTTAMRSNNAYRILLFNLFEFSMLQELVAAELGLPLGDYLHWAASMHVYDNDGEMPNTFCIASEGPGKSIKMPEMPYGDALKQANLLARYETQMRHCCSNDELDGIVAQAIATLNPYWLNLFGVLAMFVASKRRYTMSVPMYENFATLAETAIAKMLG